MNFIIYQIIFFIKKIQSPLFLLSFFLLISIGINFFLQNSFFLLLFFQLGFCFLACILPTYRITALFFILIIVLFNFTWIDFFDPYSNVCNQPDEVSGIVTSDNEYNKKHLKLKLMRLQINCNRQIFHKLQGIIDIQANSKKLKYVRTGDRFKFSNLKLLTQSFSTISFTATKHLYITNETRRVNFLARTAFFYYLQAKHHYYLTTTNYGLIESIIFGDRSFLPLQWKQKINDLGISHLLAISGMHIGIIYLWLIFIFRRWFASIFEVFPCTRKYSILSSDIVAMILLLVYLYMINLPITAIRAWIMLGVWLLVKHFLPYQSNWFILGLTAVIMMIYDPTVFYQLSFRLSFLSVAGILSILPLINFIKSALSLSKFSLMIVSSILITIWLNLITLPLILNNFSQINILATLNNLPHILYLSFILVPCGIILIMIGSFTFITGSWVGEFYVYRVINFFIEIWARFINWNWEWSKSTVIVTKYVWNSTQICIYWILLSAIMFWIRFKIQHLKNIEVLQK